MNWANIYHDERPHHKESQLLWKPLGTRLMCRDAARSELNVGKHIYRVLAAL
jgi:hypothetical protein